MSKPLPYKLLIIEDDLSILKMLRSFFIANGAEVLTAEDGQSGLELIQSSRPDVVILDVVLPYIDGFSIVEKIRSEANHVPIILLTEKSGIEEKVEGLELGADDYVTKPFSTKELLARVKTQLRHLKNSGQDRSLDPVSVGSLTISPLSREVLFAEKHRIPFTKTEFDLLYFLANKKQQVASHGDLLEHVLDYKADSETKTLVMHVANIRRKLNDAGVSDIRIKAITGIGYMLVE